jgi:RND family efflux transporter MFP subunit
MNKRNKTILWSTLSAVLAVGLVAVAVVGNLRAKARADAEKNKPAVALEFARSDIVQITPRKLAVELVLPGSVQAVSQATVRSKVSAEVRRVHVREGDQVAAGRVVVEFDTASLRAQLAERTAALESAKAQLAQAERTRSTNAQLVKQNFISQNAFDTADDALRAQLAAVEAARAQLAQTELALADAVVRAPIGGHVAKRYVQPGEKLGLDAPLLAIVDLARLEVQAQVPVADVPQIAPGAVAEIEVEGLAERSFTGRVDRINPSTEPGTRMINVYIALTNEERLLRAGMFARARLRVGDAKEAPALPLSAIQLDAGQPIVWVIDDGKLSKRFVTLGRRDERAQQVQIVGGLGPNEQVIGTKFDNLKEGLAAKIIGGAVPEAKVADKDLPAQPPAGRAAN